MFIMFNNISTILNNINNNPRYSNIFDIVESKYFSIEFNSKIEMTLSKYTTEEIVKYYMGYKELLDTFLIMVLQGKENPYLNNIDELGIDEEQLKIIMLLIYKEIDFFVLKIETILGFDEFKYKVTDYKTHLIVTIQNDETIRIDKNELEILRLMGLVYYTGERKVKSFINLLDNTEYIISE